MGHLRANPRIREIVETPILLGLLIEVFLNKGGRMPDRRSVLFEEAFGLAHGRPNDPPERLDFLARMLGTLAERAHEKSSGLLTEGEIIDQVRGESENLGRASMRINPTVERTRLLHPPEEGSPGLFVARAEGVYGFRHLQIQEYLLGRRLVDLGLYEGALYEKLFVPRWREPLLLGVGYASSTGNDVAAWLQGCLAVADPNEKWLHRRRLFVAAAIAECESLPEEFVAEQIGAIARLCCEASRPQVPRLLEEAKGALRTLGRLYEATVVKVLCSILSGANPESFEKAVVMAEELGVEEGIVQTVLDSPFARGCERAWALLARHGAASVAPSEQASVSDEVLRRLGLVWSGPLRRAVEEHLDVPGSVATSLAEGMTNYATYHALMGLYGTMEELIQAVDRRNSRRLFDSVVELSRNVSERDSVLWDLSLRIQALLARARRDRWPLEEVREEISTLLTDDGVSARYRSLCAEFGGRDPLMRYEGWGRALVEGGGRGRLLDILDALPSFPWGRIVQGRGLKEPLERAHDLIGRALVEDLRKANSADAYFRAAILMGVGRGLDALLDDLDAPTPRSDWLGQVFSHPGFLRAVKVNRDQSTRLLDRLRQDDRLASPCAETLVASTGLTSGFLQRVWSLIEQPDSEAMEAGDRMIELLYKAPVLTWDPELIPQIRRLLETGRGHELALRLLMRAASLRLDAILWLLFDSLNDPNEEIRSIAAIRIGSWSRAAGTASLQATLDDLWQRCSDALSRWADERAAASTPTGGSPEDNAREISDGLRSPDSARLRAALATAWWDPEAARHAVTDLEFSPESAWGDPEEAALRLTVLLRPGPSQIPARRLLFGMRENPTGPGNGLVAWIRERLEASGAPFSPGLGWPCGKTRTLLDDERTDVAAAAALATLATDPTHQIVRSLVATLDSPRDVLRLQANGALDVLVTGLRTDGFDDGVAAIATALDESNALKGDRVGYRGTRAVTALSNVPQHDPYWIEHWLGDLTQATDDRERIVVTGRLCAWLSLRDGCVASLAQALGSSLPLEVEAACGTLAHSFYIRAGEADRDRLLPLVADRLSHPDPDVQSTACEALAWSERAVPNRDVGDELLNLARTSVDEGVRFRATLAAARMGSHAWPSGGPTPEERFRELLDGELVRGARAGLAWIWRGSPNRPERLEEAIQSAHALSKPELEIAVANAMFDAGTVLGTPFEDFHTAIVDYVRGLDDATALDVVESIAQQLEANVADAPESPEERWAKRNDLFHYPSRNILASVFAGLAEKTGRWLLVGRREPEDMAALFATLARDPFSWVVRQAAVRTLGAIGTLTREAAGAFLDAAQDIESVVESTFDAIEEFMVVDPQAITVLLERLEDPQSNVVVRGHALILIGRFAERRHESLQSERERIETAVGTVIRNEARTPYLTAKRRESLASVAYDTLEKLTQGPRSQRSAAPSNDDVPLDAEVSLLTAHSSAASLPPGITDVRGWPDERVRARLEEVKRALDWENTTGSAQKWWEAFERENEARVGLVLRLAEELLNRRATVTEFFLAYVYSNTDNIQANLHYLDYTRVKKEEERKRREAAQGREEVAPEAQDPEGENLVGVAELRTLVQYRAARGQFGDVGAEHGEDRLRARLDKTKQAVDWENTTGSARKWWEAFEKEKIRDGRLDLVLQHAEELLNRKATVTEFFLAYVYANTDDIQATLHYLDYSRLKKEEAEKRRKAAVQKAKINAASLPPGITDTQGWAEERIRARLEEVKRALDWDNTTGSARKWWEAFEAENARRPALALRLAEELLGRSATVTEFFLAYVYSNTDNIQANLHYLDYTRVKKEEERKRREAAEGEEGTEPKAQDPMGVEELSALSKNAARDPSGRMRAYNGSMADVRTRLEETKRVIDWENTMGSARDWWQTVEEAAGEDAQRLSGILHLARELLNRKATVTEFFLAHKYSGMKSLLGNLHYLDYTRLKEEEEERKRREAVRITAPSLLSAEPEGDSSQGSEPPPFVRCPHCRSQVPANVDRCQMCGKPLE